MDTVLHCSVSPIEGRGCRLNTTCCLQNDQMDEVIDELKENKQFKRGLQPLQAERERAENQATPSGSPTASFKDADTPRTPSEEQVSSADEDVQKVSPSRTEADGSGQEQREGTGASAASAAHEASIAQEEKQLAMAAASREEILETQLRVSLLPKKAAIAAYSCAYNEQNRVLLVAYHTEGKFKL